MSDPTEIVVAFGKYSTDPDAISAVIKTSEALVKWALAAISASTGKMEFADDADNLIPGGIVIGSSDGNADHLTGDGTYKAIARSGLTLVGVDGAGVSVAGASSIADVGKQVYATDGQTLTLTGPATGLPVGCVTKWKSSTYCHVFLYPFWFSASPQLPKYDTVFFPPIPTSALEGTAAITLLTLPAAREHYKIISLHAQPNAYDTGVVAGSQVLNLAIGGTDTTGGALTLPYTSCDAAADMGTAVDATEITAANEVHQGDVVTLEMAASGTGFTADKLAGFTPYMIIERLPGA